MKENLLLFYNSALSFQSVNKIDIILKYNILMIESINSSCISQSCQACEPIRRQNQRLKQALINSLSSFQPQEQVVAFKQIRNKIDVVCSQIKKYNLILQDLTDACSYTLKEMFHIKNDILTQNLKDVFQLMINLPKHKKQSPVKKEDYAGSKKQAKIEEKPERIVHYQREDSPTQRFQKKKIGENVEERERQPTQKKPERNIFAEMNSYPRNEPLENPYLPETKKQKKEPRNRDEEQQKESSVKIDDISLPLNWQKKTFFDYTNKTITKKFNDVYKKICTVNPLPRQGKHKIKFEMVTNGTVAFGVVTAPFKDQFMINDKKCHAVKYLSFENGGGLLNLNGECINKGEQLHLNPGQVLDIVFDANKVEVSFNNPNLKKSQDITLPQQFKNKDLYFFLEMKQVNTAVKMI